MLTSKVAKDTHKVYLISHRSQVILQTIFAEMKDVVKIMKDSKELKNFFASPIIDAKRKLRWQQKFSLIFRL